LPIWREIRFKSLAAFGKKDSANSINRPLRAQKRGVFVAS
jgi:hypothetical protein